MKITFVVYVALLFLTPTLCFAMGREPKENRSREANFDHVAAQANSKTVEVFVTSWCGYCKKLERFFNDRDIPYTSYDIETNARAAEAYQSMGGTGVPVTRIGSDIVYGYDPDRILELL